jgi:ribosomal protein S18
VTHVDYKDLNALRKYVSDRGKIRGRRVSGNCQQHQRDVSDAIKVARELALLPYTQRTVTERRGRGRDRGDRGERGDRERGPRSDSRSSSSDGAESSVSVDATEFAEVEVVGDELEPETVLAIESDDDTASDESSEEVEA